MATIETMYSVGDVVFHAGTTTQDKQRPCPDCNDTKKWAAVSPAGNEYTFSCPRCASPYRHHDELSLRYTAHVPFVRKLTIGSVQYNSHVGSWDSGARYMCVETGVGGGSVYAESDLFDNEAAALVAAEAKAAVADTTVPYVVQAYNRALEISDYQLENALLKKAKEKTSTAGQLLWNVNDLFDTIKEASDKEAIIEAVEYYQSYQRDRDIERLFEIVDAARAEQVSA